MAALDPIGSALTKRQAGHLLRRATFGPTHEDIISVTGQDVSTVVDNLFVDQEVPSPPVDLATGQSWLPKPVEDVNSGGDELQLYFLSWWMDQMRVSGRTIKEKLVFFLHTHITTKADVVESATALYYQNALFRFYALGSFKELAFKICFDNAMLIFLDGRQNVKGSPQENFGREFLELYTIGKGTQVGPGDYTNYSELDVRECAKIFSGYQEDENFITIDPDTNLPTGTLRGNGLVAVAHDASNKVLSAAFGEAEIAPIAVDNNDQATKEDTIDEVTQLVDVIFDQAETAKHICRKLYRFFCYYNITDEVETNVIAPLADTFVANEFNMVPVLQQLFKSQHFYDLDNSMTTDDLTGAIIKSPLDLVIGTLRTLKIDFPDYATETQAFYEDAYQSLYNMMDDQGMKLYEPYEVAGYAAYHQFPAYNRNWISANYLGNRYQFAALLIQGINKYGDESTLSLDVVDFVENQLTGVTVSDPTELVQELVDLLLPQEIPADRLEYFLNDILLDDLPLNNWTNEWVKYLSNGDDMVVRQQLENLFIALMQSPEYQLM